MSFWKSFCDVKLVYEILSFFFISNGEGYNVGFLSIGENKVFRFSVEGMNGCRYHGRLIISHRTVWIFQIKIKMKFNFHAMQIKIFIVMFVSIIKFMRQTNLIILSKEKTSINESEITIKATRSALVVTATRTALTTKLACRPCQEYQDAWGKKIKQA